MKTFIKAFVCLTFGGLLFASCSSNRTFNANVKGVSQINIEGVKAFASLSQTASGKEATRAGNGSDSYLYAVDEYNNITLPQISCNFVFGDEVTEEERQQIIKDMNATIETHGIYDLGKYILMQYQLSYISSYIESGGKGEVTAAVGFIFSAIRKSDGKSFSIPMSTDTYRLADMLRMGTLCTNLASDSKGNCHLAYDSGAWKISEDEENASIALASELNIFFIDKNGKAYSYDEIQKIPLTDDNSTHAWGSCQVGDELYIFSYEDGKLKAYSILDSKPHLEGESAIDAGEFNFDGSQFAGCVNGEYLWYSHLALIKYNAAAKTFSVQPISYETQEFIACSNHVFANGYAYCIDEKNSYAGSAQVVKVNLFNEKREALTFDLPQGQQQVSSRFIGSIPSNYLRLKVFTNSDTHVFNIYGEEDLPDFNNYIVHEIIPLK